MTRCTYSLSDLIKKTAASAALSYAFEVIWESKCMKSLNKQQQCQPHLIKSNQRGAKIVCTKLRLAAKRHDKVSKGKNKKLNDHHYRAGFRGGILGVRAPRPFIQQAMKRDCIPVHRKIQFGLELMELMDNFSLRN